MSSCLGLRLSHLIPSFLNHSLGFHLVLITNDCRDDYEEGWDQESLTFLTLWIQDSINSTQFLEFPSNNEFIWIKLGLNN